VRGHLIVSERELFEVAERGDAHDLRDLVVREHQAVQLSQPRDSLVGCAGFGRCCVGFRI